VLSRTVAGVVAIASGGTSAAAQDASGLCLTTLQERPALAARLEAKPPEPSRLAPPHPIDLVEGVWDPLRLVEVESGAEISLDMPGWRAWHGVVGYDVEGQVLYLRSVSGDVGWAQLGRSGGQPVIERSGLVRSRLEELADIPAEPRFSHILGRLLVIGTGGSWWPFYLHRFHSLEIIGGEVRPVPEVEDRTLVFLGDDPVAGMAVLWDGEERFFHYDGATVTPAERPLLFWRNDPLSDGVLLRDDEGRPWRWAGGVLTELDPNHVIAHPV
jgi:hypothetical protein